MFEPDSETRRTSRSNHHCLVKSWRHRSGLLSGFWYDSRTPPCQLTFGTWRVNDYDLTIQHDEAVELVGEHLGMIRTRTDPFFRWHPGPATGQEGWRRPAGGDHGRALAQHPATSETLGGPVPRRSHRLAGGGGLRPDRHGLSGRGLQRSSGRYPRAQAGSGAGPLSAPPARPRRAGGGQDHRHAGRGTAHRAGALRAVTASGIPWLR